MHDMVDPTISQATSINDELTKSAKGNALIRVLSDLQEGKNVDT